MKAAFASITLDKNTPIPLYFQLKKQLLALIENGALGNDDKLPTEKELCDWFGISRPTVRQAFSELKSEGYLRRHKGNGTFISIPKDSARFFSQISSFEDEMLEKGKTPATHVQFLGKISALPAINEKLKLSLDAPLICLTRLRFADKTPLVLVDTYLSCLHYAGLLNVDFTTNSLYNVLESNFNTRINRVTREIEAVNARKKEAELLQISHSKALILTKTHGYTENKQEPVEYSVARYRGDVNTFDVEIFR